MAIPRRAVERNRIYRRLQQDLHVIDARSVIEKDLVKRKMWDIEDENEDDDEENKRARRE
jgi:RNase P protein component